MPASGSPWPPPAERSSITVAASRGTTGSAVPAPRSSDRSAHAAGIFSRERPMAIFLARVRSTTCGLVVSDLGDQLDLHRGVQRQHRDADRAPGVLARFTEHL